jgi:hypothetical protein
MKQAANDLVSDTTLSSETRKQILLQAEKDLGTNLSLKDEERTALAAAYSNARKDIDKQEMEAKREMANNIGSILGSISELVGKQTTAGKALAVAETTISTYAAAQQAYKSQMTIADPSAPIRAAIAAGAAIASGLVRVKGILSVKVPGAVSAPSISSSAPIGPSAPSNAVTTLDRDSINAFGNQAIKAYVVETDMTNNQQKVERINRAARFG